MVEQSVLDDLPQKAVEHLSGDLAGVGGGLGQLVLGLLVRAVVAEHVGAAAQVVVPDLQLVRKIVNLERDQY